MVNVGVSAVRAAHAVPVMGQIPMAEIRRRKDYQARSRNFAQKRVCRDEVEALLQGGLKIGMRQSNAWRPGRLAGARYQLAWWTHSKGRLDLEAEARGVPTDEVLPWDHRPMAKQFLLKELDKALMESTPDCR
jgi:hypothetical protein